MPEQGLGQDCDLKPQPADYEHHCPSGIPNSSLESTPVDHTSRSHFLLPNTQKPPMTSQVCTIVFGQSETSTMIVALFRYMSQYLLIISNDVLSAKRNHTCWDTRATNAQHCAAARLQSTRAYSSEALISMSIACKRLGCLAG